MTTPVIPARAIQAAHAEICEQNIDDCLDHDWRGKCVKAVEAAAPYMLTKVSTVRELEALPRLSVIRTDEGTVYERHTMWHEAGSRDLKYSPDIRLPATVLQHGWGEE